MAFIEESYLEQVKLWPKEGRHILAQFDERTVIVYQAYRPTIGRFAIENGHFGGEFSYSRMSWVKPNFLWMMYRSGWGTKDGQEITLGLRVSIAFFDRLLAEAVPSSWDTNQYQTEDVWSGAVNHSSVRLQWDPDHGPSSRQSRATSHSIRSSRRNAGIIRSARIGRSHRFIGFRC